MGQNVEFLIGFPVAMSIFLVILQQGPLLQLFIMVGALAVSIALVLAMQALSGTGVEFLGFGVELPDIKEFSLKLVFTTTFLTALYTTNVLAGLNLILQMPVGLGIVIFGVLSSIYVFGIFSLMTDV